MKYIALIVAMLAISCYTLEVELTAADDKVDIYEVTVAHGSVAPTCAQTSDTRLAQEGVIPCTGEDLRDHYTKGNSDSLWTGSWPVSSLWDKSTSTSVWTNKCFHNRSTNGWFNIDLDGTYSISKVNILNRGDCCGHRIKGAVIKVCTGDDCKQVATVPTGDKSIDVEFEATEGNRIRVEKKGDYINICELTAFGCPA